MPRKKNDNKTSLKKSARYDGIIDDAVDNTTALNPVVGFNTNDIVKSLASTLLMAARHPLGLAQHAAAYGGKLIDISQQKRAYSPGAKDRRFKDNAWQDKSTYNYLMQSYLALRESMDEWVDSNDFTELDERRAQFILAIIGDSMAPTNNLLGNPTALKKAWETKGDSLVKGFGNFLSDLRKNGGLPSQVDKSKFSIGENIAVTPGKVVFKNEILELIQYKPSTKQVHKIPLLVIPPQINKYYVFDLLPEKSFVKYCAASSLQTFVISWRNPGPEYKDWDLDDYVTAVIEAVDAIKSITRQKKINVNGACSGGITASLVMGYLEAQGDNTINCLSTSVCVLSQKEEDSDMSIFVSDKKVEAARKKSRKKGVVRGRELSRVFTWMRPNDLIWNYVVNNYLMGQKPPAFDILYWNSDVTNLPAGLHSDYLDIITGRQLEKPGETVINGHEIKLHESSCDKYIAAGLTDHITPWQACYRSVNLLGGNIKFVLSSSGHIQPGNPRSKLYFNKKLPKTANEWKDGAVEHSGTWWDDWQVWIQKRSGDLKNAPRKQGNKKYPPIEDAPGSYVFQSAD